MRVEKAIAVVENQLVLVLVSFLTTCCVTEDEWTVALFDLNMSLLLDFSWVTVPVVSYWNRD